MKLFGIVLTALSLIFSIPPYAAQAAGSILPVTVETVGRPVQVFDVTQGKVVAALPNTPEIQQEARQWINAIKGFAAQIKGEPKDGLVLRIELAEPALLPPEISREPASEVFVIIHADPRRPAQLLLFTKKGQPLLVDTQAELTPFLRKHDLLKYLKKSPSST
ncbi:hypothetical protein [Paenibacillus hamazuiensis]|uniref:hypothetical protein n=1 Tax=Paenibacillus hamazuiensis TaxID=2936508 RepID=UPI00200CB8B8|nr:hypothetical protein [Paenibacillus hamazuiensis]